MNSKTAQLSENGTEIVRLFARFALGASFLSAVADRFGLWGHMEQRLGTKGGAATLQARTRHGEVTDEGDCGDGSGCGNGRGKAGGAARAASGDKRRRCSDSCVGIHRG